MRKRKIKDNMDEIGEYIISLLINFNRKSDSYHAYTEKDIIEILNECKKLTCYHKY